MLRSLFVNKPELKSPRELGLMREAGKLVAEALRICRGLAVPGRKTIEIDQAVETFFARHGAVPRRDLSVAQRAGGSRHPRTARPQGGRPAQDRHGLQAERLVCRCG